MGPDTPKQRFSVSPPLVIGSKAYQAGEARFTVAKDS